MSISALPTLATGAKAAKRMSVCVVSSEILGPIKNGGIATATTALAKRLVADGHAVTLLYTFVLYGKPVAGDEKPWRQWVEQLASEGIVLEHIPHFGGYRDWREASWLVKEFLGQRNFELVYFNDHFGSGYYAQLAKRAGLAPFSEQLHCVITHGSMEWVFSINDQYAQAISDVEWMGLERRSVELADVVIGPSSYLLREYEKFGWRLPAQIFHQPYPILTNPGEIDPTRRFPIRELVFFGRLEARKGLWLFCEAVDRLVGRFPEIEVTFLGKVTEFSGISSALQIVNRSSNWPFRVRLLNDYDQDQALSYLRGAGRLAVMPSIADNSPCVVYECMERVIPFVATGGSGADELVHPDAWPEVLVQPNVESLALRLEEILERGAVLGHPRFDPAQNIAAWSGWHRYVAENRLKLIERASSSRSEAQQGALVGQEKTAALIVVIDNGGCTLSLLIGNLASHMRRFGPRAAYLLLTTRRGEIQEALLDIFSGDTGAGTPFAILDSRAVDEARRLIAASAFVFFTDAETEILTPFFVSAINLLQRRQPTFVSCVVATRERRDQDGEIEILPSGDIPGLAAVGRPIGGSVWALSAASLSEKLSALEIYDPQTDTFYSSLVLGQLLMQQCRHANTPIHLLPVVGAIETREGRAPWSLPEFREARRFANALGIVPSMYKGGAAWFAISACGAFEQGDERAALDCSTYLSEDHPYSAMRAHDESNSRGTDLSELAASFGRVELALQLEAGNSPSAGKIRHLSDVATRAMRERPHWELASALKRKRATGFGLDALFDALERSGSKIALSSDVTSDEMEFAAIYVDSKRLRVRRNKIEAAASLRVGGPGNLFILDVPLCGHSWLTATLHSSSNSDPAFVRLKLIDQRHGLEMGTIATRLAADRTAELSIPLHEVFGRATILLQFSGAQKLEVTAESIRVW